MGKQYMSRSYTVFTTTLLVERPIDFSLLDARYQLVRYELPVRLLERSEMLRSSRKAEQVKEQDKLYVQLHADLRESFNAPYKTYKYDMLDGRPKWVVYVLYPREHPLQTLYLSPNLCGKCSPIQGQVMAWERIPLHLLLKLLQVHYILGNASVSFIGQDDCYIYAKTIRRSDSTQVDICLRIQLQEHLNDQEQDKIQQFSVISRACPFRYDPHPRPGMKTYYARKIQQGKVYYVQLKSADVQRFQAQEKPLYTIIPSQWQRTTLPYLDMQHIEASKGTILYDFLLRYRDFLQLHGIVCHFRKRTFTEWRPLPVSCAQLPIYLLGTIGIYDNRLQSRFTALSTRKVPFEGYVQLIRTIAIKAFPGIQVVPISNLSQAQQQQIPTLILQDYEEDDFKEDGCFFGHLDPYHTVYKAFPLLVKQSLNINSNSQEEIIPSLQPISCPESIDRYLQYDLPGKDDTLFNHKVQTSFIQLYLKEVILHKKSVQNWLPCFPTPYCFLRKLRTHQKDYEILLTIEQDTLQFVNLRTLKGKDRCSTILRSLGIDWSAMRFQMQQKYQKYRDQLEEKDDSGIPSYHVVVGPHSFVKIEDLNERLLYDAPTIKQRQQELYKPLPIEDFKLLPHFERLCPKNKTEAQQRYVQFQKYDSFLTELSQQYEELSFNQLTQQEYLQLIGPILGEKCNAEGYYSRVKIKRYYQHIGMFPSEKANELHLFKGVWNDEADHCYLIGSPHSIHYTQDKPTLIRHFHAYQGKDQFDYGPLLDATTVQFVRLRQYTVYPYPFHLIDLYIEHVGRFQDLPEIF